ncbi:MAG: ATP-binding protein [Candidatus Omnitrophota bacterium]
MKKCIFISSVQKELVAERVALKNFILGNELLRHYFEVFLFEDIPASDRNADDEYLAEVKHCPIYLGIFGNEYGRKTRTGRSSTHNEFLTATKLGKTRLIYVKGKDDRARESGMKALISSAGQNLIRRRFNTTTELLSAVYASLIRYLHEHGSLITDPFDAAVCRNAGFKDISKERLQWFVSRARDMRGYALTANTPVKDALIHLDMLEKKRLTNAAILVFGENPQRFFRSSEVKCMHFHSASKSKPIPSYQVFKGTVFDLADKAVDFVMSKLSRSVGTRARGPEAPVEYDIPPEAVSEGIINAIAHRDYTSKASIEIMLFSDRLEIWNPGTLPEALTVQKLRKPHSSYPHNPLIADPLFLTKYIEKAGTGIVDMFDRCRKAGIRPPLFRVNSEMFILTLWRKRGSGVASRVPEKVLEKVPEKVTDNQKMIIARMKKDPHVVIGELARIVGISERKIRENIGKLKKKKLILRIGPDKGGYWKVCV